MRHNGNIPEIKMRHFAKTFQYAGKVCDFGQITRLISIVSKPIKIVVVVVVFVVVIFVQKR